ncbi:hypothetical protein DU504_16605 [Haloplanus salinus]|uniref:Uncharacterized protein n=1 Tax=Haloplanus salinus TaxID=1126245 RepID=A0A368N2I4_9EURY|nr:hypothetical protein [Haloplanus salinus]RCU44380.1 hypothetical protein DU504_16605 [Haloplanus salinus]
MSRYSIPVKKNTRDRLRAFSNRNLLDRQSYDEAVNELLDYTEFATAEELNAEYRPVERGRS